MRACVCAHVHACMCVCVCEGPRRGAVGPEACVHIQGHIQRSHPGLGKAEGVAATWSLGLASGGRWGAAAANTSEAGRAEMLSRRVYFSKPRGCLLMASQRAGTYSPPPPHRLLPWDPWDARSTEGADPSCFNSCCFVFSFGMEWGEGRADPRDPRVLQTAESCARTTRPDMQTRLKDCLRRPRLEG